MFSCYSVYSVYYLAISIPVSKWYLVAVPILFLEVSFSQFRFDKYIPIRTYMQSPNADLNVGA